MILYAFVSGAITLGFGMAALFFLRFWKSTRDGLFLSFAMAFGLLALGQAILALGDFPIEDRSWIYLTRLAAFLLILLAIYRKNRTERR